MNEMTGLEQDIANLNGDMERIGGYLARALGEVATELGGEDYAMGIIESSKQPNTPWPSFRVVKSVDDTYPGALSQIMDRASEIQEETNAQKLAEIKKLTVRKLGKSIMDGFASMMNGVASWGDVFAPWSRKK